MQVYRQSSFEFCTRDARTYFLLPFSRKSLFPYFDFLLLNDFGGFLHDICLLFEKENSNQDIIREGQGYKKGGGC